MSGEVGIPWFKVFATITTVAGSVGGAVYWWTSKVSANNHQLKLAKKEMEILETKKALIEKDKKELEECKKIPISFLEKEPKRGCWKEYKTHE